MGGKTHNASSLRRQRVVVLLFVLCLFVFSKMRNTEYNSNMGEVAYSEKLEESLKERKRGTVGQSARGESQRS